MKTSAIQLKSILDESRDVTMDYLSQFTSVIVSLWRFVEAKIVGGAFLAIYGFFFHIDHGPLMAALIALLIFDLVMGVAAAKKCGEEIQSRKILKTAFKFSVYGLLISSAHLTEVAIGITGEWAALEQSMIGFLAATELISITENAGRMGYSVPQRFLNQLKDYRNPDRKK